MSTEIPSEDETVLELNQFHLSQEVKSTIRSLSTQIKCSPEESLEMSLREHFCLPTEYQYEFEQEMLKHVHDLKNEIREKGWWERNSPEVSQTSFLRSENSDAELGFKFE